MLAKGSGTTKTHGILDTPGRKKPTLRTYWGLAGKRRKSPEKAEYFARASKFLTRSEAIKHVQRFALCLFFFSINFEALDPFSTNGFFSVSKLTGLIYLITIIPQVRYLNRADIRNPFLQPIWFFFGILTLVSLININVISYNFFDFTIFQNIFLFWLLFNHERKDRLVLEKGMLSFALGSFFLSLLFFAGIGIEYDGGRVSIFGDNPNSIGLRMSISLTILILAIVQNRLKFGRLRYILLLLIPIMIQLMVETGSRVALISFALAFVTGVVLFKTKKVLGKIAVFAVGAIAIICFLIFLTQSEILTQRLLISYMEGDLAGRDIIWERLLSLIESNPIFGVGETGYAYFSQITFGEETSPHNVILEVICYTGFVGLIVYLTFLYRILRRGYQNYKKDGFLLQLLLLIPVFGILVSGQILYQKIGWVIFAYIVGSSVYKSKSETVVRINAHTYENYVEW